MCFAAGFRMLLSRNKIMNEQIIRIMLKGITFNGWQKETYFYDKNVFKQMGKCSQGFRLNCASYGTLAFRLNSSVTRKKKLNTILKTLKQYCVEIELFQTGGKRLEFRQNFRQNFFRNKKKRASNKSTFLAKRK